MLERLVDPNSYGKLSDVDNTFLLAFINSFPLYVSSTAVLNHVLRACDASIVEASKNADGTPLATPIFLRGINFLKIWIDQYWSDFSSENQPLMEQLNKYLDSMENQKLSGIVKAAMKKKLKPIENNIDMSAYPKPILPKQKGFFTNAIDHSREASASSANELTLTRNPDLIYKFQDLDSLEIARQLTLIEHRMFQQIQVS